MTYPTEVEIYEADIDKLNDWVEQLCDVKTIEDMSIYEKIVERHYDLIQQQKHFNHEN